MALLYKYQLVKLTRYKEPGIYLGFDLKNSKKIWVVCLDVNGAPEIDWFDQNMVGYYRTKASKDNGTPDQMQIIYGKYKINLPNHYYHNDLTKEELAKLGSYVEELYNKYKDEKDKT